MKGKGGKDAGRAVLGTGATGIDTQLAGQGRVDVPRLPGGMGPIRRAVGTALFPAFQFAQFAADLHGQDGDTPQAPPLSVGVLWKPVNGRETGRPESRP